MQRSKKDDPLRQPDETFFPSAEKANLPPTKEEDLVEEELDEDEPDADDIRARLFQTKE